MRVSYAFAREFVKRHLQRHVKCHAHLKSNDNGLWNIIFGYLHELLLENKVKLHRRRKVGPAFLGRYSFPTSLKSPESSTM